MTKMDGPAHWRTAGGILAEVAALRQKIEQAGATMVAPALAEAIDRSVGLRLAEAQVHATLALTAATAANIRRNGAVSTSTIGWDEVLGEPTGVPTCPEHQALALRWGDVWVCPTGPECEWRQRVGVLGGE
jgi:hypothetical protein